MPTLYEQRNVSMKPDLWQALEALAVATNSRSTRGPKAFQHSWQSLIERIAGDEFELVERNPNPIEATLAEVADRLEAEQRIAYEREAQAQGRDITTPHRKLRRSQLDGDAPKRPLQMHQLDMFR